MQSVFVAVFHAGQCQRPEQQGGPLQAGSLLYTRRGDLVELHSPTGFGRKATRHVTLVMANEMI